MANQQPNEVQIDANEVIQYLTQRIAQLELEKAMLAAQLNQAKQSEK
jgi:hypothetical protein